MSSNLLMQELAQNTQSFKDNFQYHYCYALPSSLLSLYFDPCWQWLKRKLKWQVRVRLERASNSPAFSQISPAVRSLGRFLRQRLIRDVRTGLACRQVYILTLYLAGLDVWASRPSHLGFNAMFMYQRGFQNQFLRRGRGEKLQASKNRGRVPREEDGTTITGEENLF